MGNNPSPTHSPTSISCSSGYGYVDATTCSPCSAGTYSSGGSSSCMTCSGGTYSGANAAKCTSTPSGYYTLSGAASCCSLACQAGTYSAGGTSACSNCAAGKYQGIAARSNCSTVPAGYYSGEGASEYSICNYNTYSASGASDCTACPTGKHAPVQGATACVLIPTGQPTSQPSRQPSGQPTSQPASLPSSKPSRQPSSQPTTQPTRQPSNQPTALPTNPTSFPTGLPSSQPSSIPSSQPLASPTGVPSGQPSTFPTNQPTSNPTAQPSRQPTREPSGQPSAQPSHRPTSQPSMQPSSQPSGQPSCEPTGQPSCIPTSQPTGMPTSQPSCQPTSSPTGQPSFQPTGKPSAQPTRQPSGQPSRQPTRQPTGQPTGKPTRQPTSQPSTQPTVKPSCQPTSTPTMQPSGQPSTYPTCHPTAQPSRQPSGQPTVAPSGQPTTSPSSAPTSIPTCVPSSQPSSQPSNRPSCKPTTQPSNQPTAQPSYAPSSQPTGQPTTRPSSIPSSKPTMQPSGQPTRSPSVQPSGQPTRQPTLQPTCQPSRRPSTQPSAVPTANPTSAPSISLAPTMPWTGYNITESYRYYKQQLIPFASNLGPLFSYYYYRGDMIDGNCASWQYFKSNNLKLPLDTMYFSSLRLRTYSFDLKRQLPAIDADATCSDRNAIASLLSTLQSTSQQAYSLQTCNGRSWRASNCEYGPSLCVDCPLTNCSVPICPNIGTQFSMNPCSINTVCHNNLVAHFGIASFIVSTEILYPILFSITPVSISTDRVKLTLNVSKAGDIYCAGLLAGSQLSSEFVIKQANYRVTALAAGLVDVVVLGLIPASSYDMYCYTQDDRQHFMDITAVTLTKISLVTICCRRVSLVKQFSQIKEFVTGKTTSESIFVVGIDSAPSDRDLVLTAVAIPYNCTYSAVSFPTVAIYPPLITFAVGTASLKAQFIIRGPPSCFNISWVSSSPLYDSIAPFSVSILSLSTPPTPPVLSLVQFSNTGSQLVITFSSSTNKGKAIVNPAKSFSCSYLFVFINSWSSKCVWQTDSVVVASLFGNASNPLSIVPGDSTSVFSLRQGVVTALCPSGLICSSNIAQTVTILSPAQPIVPIVSLSYSSSIGSCDSITIDPTQSNGQAGRAWKEVTWSVSHSTLSDSDLQPLLNFLSTTYSDTASVIKVANALLEPGVYQFNLRLGNFLNQYSSATAIITMSSSSFVVQTRILGPSAVSLYRPNQLSLTASTILPSCDTSTGTSATITLSTTWKIYLNGALQGSIVSVSPSPSSYRLVAYTLQARSVYVLQVSAVASQTQGSVVTTSEAASTVFVQVGSMGVVAAIKGGAYRLVGQSQSILVDASASYDADYPVPLKDGSNNGVLYYTWVCTELAPSFGDACQGQSITSNTSSIYSFNSTAAAASQVFVVVVVTNTFGDSSSDNTTISILIGETPVVSIAPITSKFNPSSRLVLQGTVEGRYLTTVNWNCTSVGVDLSSIALSPLMKVITTNKRISTAYSLSIKSDALVAGLTYSFELSAGYSGLNSLRVSSVVTVTMNAPPVGGVINIDPPFGIALNTTFNWITSLWYDDPSDYPIFYIFSYNAPPSSQVTVAKYYSTAAYVSLMMGQGNTRNNYFVVCFASAADIYNSSSKISTELQIKPPDGFYTAQISSLVQSSSSGVTMDPSLAFTLVSAVSSAMNAVNCTVIRPCADLNREDCALTARTCGKCLSGFIGESGDSNYPCMTAAALTTASRCSSGADCPLSGICDSNSGSCASPPKSCPAQCSGVGDCIYYAFSGDVIAYCSSYDSSCKATCTCWEGYYGSDCSLTKEQLQVNIGIRETLCGALLTTSIAQDVTVDVVASRASAVSGLLLDTTQVSHTALDACVALLTNTIIEHPTIAADESVADDCLSALSIALQLGAYLPAEVIQNITLAASTLSAAMEESLIVGEVPTVIINDNVRMSSVKIDSENIASTVFSEPVSDVEIALNSPAASATISDDGSSSNGILSVSMVKYTSNIHNSSSMTSSIIGMRVASSTQLLTSSTSSSTTDPVAAATADGSIVHLTLPNINPIDYASVFIPQENRSVVCVAKASPYNISLPCSHNRSFPYICNTSDVDLLIPYICPRFELKPLCSTWDSASSAFYPNPFCSVVSFTSSATICACQQGYASYSYSDADHRRLDGSSSSDPALVQFASVATAVGENFVDTISSVTHLTASDIAHNALLFGVMCGILVIFFVGLGVVIWVDNKEIDLNKNSLSKKISTVLFSDLLTRAIPSDLAPNVSWNHRLWKLLELQHDVIGLFCPYSAEGDYRTTRWLKVIGLILNFLFINTVLAVQYFDDNSCIGRTTEAMCIAGKSLDQVNTMCLWEASKSKCTVNGDATDSPLAVMIAASATTILAIPLQIIFQVMLGQVRKFVQASLTKTAIKKNRAASEHIDTKFLTVTDLDTYSTKRSKRAIILRAAKLRKMQEVIDDVTVEEEVQSLQTFLKKEQEEEYQSDNELLTARSNRLRRKPSAAISSSRLSGRGGSYTSRIEATAEAAVETFAEIAAMRNHANGHANQADSDPRNNANSSNDNRATAHPNREQLQYHMRNPLIPEGVPVAAMASSLAIHYHSLMLRFRRVSHFLSSNTSKKYLTKCVTKAREGSKQMVEKMNQMPNDAERSEYLMRKFTLYVLSDYHQNIAGRFFSVFIKGAVDGDLNLNKFSIIFVFLLPCYMIFMALYVFLFGVSIGPKASRIWLTNCIITFLHSLLIIRPIVIWAKALALSSVVRVDVHSLHNHLQKINSIVMTRQRGYMKYANSRIQHLNMACRAARQHPRLTASRFLMSLTDFDFPRVLHLPTTKTKREMLFEGVFVVLFIALGFMPEPLQDAALETVSGTITNAVVLGLAVLGHINVSYLIAVIVFIGCGLVLLFATYWSQHKPSRVSPERGVADSKGTIDDGSRDTDLANHNGDELKTDSNDKYIAMEENYAAWKGNKSKNRRGSNNPRKQSSTAVVYSDKGTNIWLEDASAYPDQDDFFDPDK